MLMPCQTGIGRRSQHPTIRSISPSVGDKANRLFQDALGKPACATCPHALIRQATMSTCRYDGS